MQIIVRGGHHAHKIIFNESAMRNYHAADGGTVRVIARSNSDLGRPVRHVRSTPDSRHRRATRSGPFSANSRHRTCGSECLMRQPPRSKQTKKFRVILCLPTALRLRLYRLNCTVPVGGGEPVALSLLPEILATDGELCFVEPVPDFCC
jgi:hypothetical protein